MTFRFNPTGRRGLRRSTPRENIGKPFAIVLDNQVISAPVIQAHIAGGSGIITGNFTPEESTRLAILLRAGALPAEITVLEQRTVGPELGADFDPLGRHGGAGRLRRRHGLHGRDLRLLRRSSPRSAW